MYLTQIQIPRSWYIIQDPPLNQFILYEDGVPITITVPIGNYTNIQLFQEVQNLLNDATLNAVTYTVLEQNTTFLGEMPDPDLNAIVITSSNPLIISQLYFSDKTIMDIILGFMEGFNNFVGGVLLGGFYNLAAENTIIVTSSCVRSVVNDNSISNQTLCNVSVGNVPPGCFITQKYDLKTNRKPFNKVSQSFQFTFENSVGVNSFYLNLINCDFVINFFTYTETKPYLEKAIRLMAIIAER
jgi:hypothetical protein